MAEVTKLTTFKNVVSIPNFITYLKSATDDIVVPEAGLIAANLTTNGSQETWAYKGSVLQAAPVAQGTCIIKLHATTDSAILAIINANPGYVWNVTQNEVIYCRGANTTSGEISCVRGLFGTAVGTWAISDVIKYMNTISLSAYVPMVHGEWTATMTFNPVATDVLTVTCGGVTKTYTAVSADPDTGEFVPGADIAATCALLAPMIAVDFVASLASVTASATGFVMIQANNYALEPTVIEFAVGNTGAISFAEDEEPVAATGIGGRGIGVYEPMPGFGIGQAIITP